MELQEWAGCGLIVSMAVMKAENAVLLREYGLTKRFTDFRTSLKAMGASPSWAMWLSVRKFIGQEAFDYYILGKYKGVKNPARYAEGLTASQMDRLKKIEEKIINGGAEIDGLTKKKHLSVEEYKEQLKARKARGRERCKGVFKKPVSSFVRRDDVPDGEVAGSEEKPKVEEGEKREEVGKPGASAVEAIQFVAENLRNKSITREDCPSGTAWNLLQECRTNPLFAGTFWNQLFAKTLPSRGLLDDGKPNEDFDGSEQVDLIDKLMSLKAEAEG